jgi:uncharacterized protein DUF1587
VPPAGARRPDDDTYHGLIASIEGALDSDARAKPRPGRVPVHRLNRTEYTNAIRDLLALDVDGRQLIADEPGGHGFDNAASVLTASPALIESYLSAAATVSRLAIGRAAGCPSGISFQWTAPTSSKSSWRPHWPPARTSTPRISLATRAPRRRAVWL